MPARLLARPRPAPRRRGLLRRLLAWHAAWKSRRRLARLELCRLDDLGLTEAEVWRETRRPFWDAPDHWLR